MTLVSTQRTPFTWGRGGSRISPDDLRARQAMQNAQPDFSPVASPWQGLGRVAQNLLGAWELRDIDRSQAQQQATAAADRSAQIAALLGQGNADLAAGLSSVDPVVSALAGDVFKSRQPKAQTPLEIERLGLLGGLTPEEIKAGARKAFDAKADPFTNLVVGGNSVFGPQSLVAQSLGGSAPAAPQQPAWFDAFTPEEIAVMQGEAARRQGIQGGSNIPSGSPLQPLSRPQPQSKRLSNGQTAYLVNGEWYDNPEGL